MSFTDKKTKNDFHADVMTTRQHEKKTETPRGFDVSLFGRILQKKEAIRRYVRQPLLQIIMKSFGRYFASQPNALAPNTAASLSFNSEGITFTLPL